MNTYIVRSDSYGSEKNAGAKAPNDVNKICKELGWRKVEIKMASHGMKKVFFALFRTPFQWIKIGKMSREYVLYQYPMYGGTKIAKLMIPIIQKVFSSKVIVLIHDLESLRYHKSDREIQFIGSCSYIICHNGKMKKYLVSKGVDADKIVELEIFDYLCETKACITHANQREKSIAIAGNLSANKSGYIYKLIENNPTLKVDLYGVGYERQKAKSNVEYHGSFSPEELPSKLCSDFGLVWDGPEIISCCGNYGTYLKYNNPHKLSLYMVAGIPVVTWKEAAIADFVKEHQVGIVVDSLMELSRALDGVTNEQYAKMRMNAEMIGAKLRNGFYFRRALREIFDIDTSKNKTRTVVK